jgi:TetR/AcrR family transcriptional regulator
MHLMAARAHREEEIIASALEIAEERGINGITTAALARRMAFTEAALYRYFSGKGAIIAAALRFLAERLFATMAIELEPTAVGHGQEVAAQLERHVQRFAWKNGLLLELVLCATGGRDDVIQEQAGTFLHDYGERMGEYFARLLELGLVSIAVAPDELARIWICQLLGGFLRSRLTDEPWNPSSHIGFVSFVRLLHPAGS